MRRKVYCETFGRGDEAKMFRQLYYSLFIEQGSVPQGTQRLCRRALEVGDPS
jgi:hypothetical protein